jgi:hypothetical protein
MGSFIFVKMASLVYFFNIPSNFPLIAPVILKKPAGLNCVEKSLVKP